MLTVSHGFKVILAKSLFRDLAVFPYFDIWLVSVVGGCSEGEIVTGLRSAEEPGEPFQLWCCTLA